MIKLKLVKLSSFDPVSTAQVEPYESNGTGLVVGGCRKQKMEPVQVGGFAGCVSVY